MMNKPSARMRNPKIAKPRNLGEKRSSIRRGVSFLRTPRVASPGFGRLSSLQFWRTIMATHSEQHLVSGSPDVTAHNMELLAHFMPGRVAMARCN